MINIAELQFRFVSSFAGLVSECIGFHFVDYVTKSVAYLIWFDFAITFSIKFN